MNDGKHEFLLQKGDTVLTKSDFLVCEVIASSIEATFEEGEGELNNVKSDLLVRAGDSMDQKKRFAVGEGGVNNKKKAIFPLGKGNEL